MNFRWSPNATPREESEVTSIAAAHGVTLPDGVEVRVMPAAFFDEEHDEWATYCKLDPRRARVALSDLQTKSGAIVIKLHEGVLLSDEAIVEVLAHECYEITELLLLFEETPTMPASRFAFLIDPKLDGAIHRMADRHGKELVRRMREET